MLLAHIRWIWPVALVTLGTSCMPRLTPEERAERNPTDTTDTTDETDETDETDDTGGPVDTEPPPSPIPLAVCDASTYEVQPPFDQTTLRGGASYTPNGDAVEGYLWTFVTRPAGSAIELAPGPVAADRTLTPDLNGTYQAELVVQTATESSLPCAVTVQAIPGAALTIEVFWTHPDDDMDLHLLAPGGVLREATDCYYGNCRDAEALDWGAPGPEGNPAMDLDDVPGLGPELVRITDAIGDGTYRVVVQDYPGSVYNGPNPTTVNVYFAGVLAWTGTRDMDVIEGTYVTFAAIDFPSGVVRTCVDEAC